MTDISPTGTSTSSPDSETGKLPALDPRFECPICLNCLKDPFLTSCGHRFCKDCIIQWMKRQGGVCPIDGYSLTMESDLFPDNYTRREIAQQRLRCPVEDCTQVLSLVDAEQHMSEHHPSNCEDCMRCSFHNVGCNFIAMSVEHMKMHLNNDLHNHLSLISSVCSGLSSRLTNNAITSKAEEAKLWDPRPKHDDSDSTSSSEESQLKELVKNLFERIVLLEQKTREQDVQLTGAHQHIVRLSVEIDRLKSDLPLRVCGGAYVWNISDFRRKLQKMKLEPSIMFYSPGFYTSYHGYRFCARLNLNVSDTSFITLNVHVMQGENDRVLQWPFIGRISLTLVHPQDPSLTISETMMSRPELEAFKRPTKEINSRAFGYAEFVSVGTIESYLQNDCLTLHIQVKSV